MKARLEKWQHNLVANSTKYYAMMKATGWMGMGDEEAWNLISSLRVQKLTNSLRRTTFPEDDDKDWTE